MENHHRSSAAPPNAKGDSGSGSPEKKDVDVPPNLSSASEVAATVAASNDVVDNVVSKGKNVAAADNKEKELGPHIIAERKRRDRMRDYFAELQTLVQPQIPDKSDKRTIVEYTIGYIQYLEKTMAMLENRKLQLELARQQAAADGVASSSSARAPPQAAHGVAVAPAAMSSDVVQDASSHAPPVPVQPAVPAPAPAPAMSSADAVVVPQPAPQQPSLAAAAEPAPAPAPQFPVTARRVGFQTWTWPDHLVLSVSNDNAYLSVCAPRHRGMLTMVMVLSVLDKYGIDVLTAQVDSDAVRTVFNIYAHVAATAMGGENPPLAVEVYQLAVSEILVWLNTS